MGPLSNATKEMLDKFDIDPVSSKTDNDVIESEPKLIENSLDV